MILSKETEMAGHCKLEENPGKSVVTESKGESILKRREANYGKCFYEVLQNEELKLSLSHKVYLL